MNRLLTHEEVVALAQRVETGDLNAKRVLIERNMGLVYAIAKKWGGLTLEDRVQEGCIGLIRAVEQFDYRVGTRFSTYATPKIKQAIQRAVENQDREIRIPVHVLHENKAIERFRVRFFSEHGCDPSPDEIATALKITQKEAASRLALLQQPLSLDAAAGDSETAIQNLVGAEDVAFDIADDRDSLERWFRFLSAQEQDVIERLYGVGDNAEHSLAEAGRALDLSRERIRQIRDQALDKLRRVAT